MNFVRIPGIIEATPLEYYNPAITTSGWLGKGAVAARENMIQPP